MSAELDAVSKAKKAYVVAKATLEQRLREELRKELANLQTQIDLAVRFAYAAGWRKAEIMRSLGTKDYHTINWSLERTAGVTEVVGTNPLDTCYAFDPESGELFVTYDKHGSLNISGSATFTFQVMQDGTKWFASSTPLWNDDYTVRNDVVAALDNRQDGEYYDEALAWVENIINGS